MRTASLREKSLTEVKLVMWQSACVLHTAQNMRIASSLPSASTKLIPRNDGIDQLIIHH